MSTKSITEPRAATDKLGYGGVLVINGYITEGNINLYAFDLACPVEIDREIKIVPDNSGNAACPQCKEVYNIGSGTGIPTKGISKHALRKYNVGNNGGNRFLISN
ncbi:MAG: hypothetical protein LIO93_09885 [Bacteroidales bacterium]|nr:hypothetical protein [Bacteroidales bacterium]